MMLDTDLFFPHWSLHIFLKAELLPWPLFSKSEFLELSRDSHVGYMPRSPKDSTLTVGKRLMVRINHWSYFPVPTIVSGYWMTNLA